MAEYERDDEQWVEDEKAVARLRRMLAPLAAKQGKVIGSYPAPGGGFMVTVEHLTQAKS